MWVKRKQNSTLVRIRNSSDSFHRTRNSQKRHSVQIERTASDIRKSPLVPRLEFCRLSQLAAARLAKSKVSGDLVVMPVSRSHPEYWAHSIPDQNTCLAGELRSQGANVTLMAHSDMLAYRVPKEPPQLAFPKFVSSYVVSA
jgi:hypothetical protein